MTQITIRLNLDHIKQDLRLLEEYVRKNPVYRKQHHKQIVKGLIEPYGYKLKKYLKILDAMYTAADDKNSLSAVCCFKTDKYKSFSKHVRLISNIIPNLELSTRDRKELRFFTVAAVGPVTKYKLVIEPIENGEIVTRYSLKDLKKMLVYYYSYYKDLTNFLLHNKPFNYKIIL